MTIARRLRRVTLAAVALSSVGVFQAASAAPGETTAGTDITNTATVSYTVGTVVQTPLNSNTVTFEVDRKIDLSVSAGLPTITNPGSNNAAVMFTVANDGNDADSYTLAVDPNRPGDDFDVSNVEIYRDDGDGVFDAGDTLISAPLALARDTSAVVFVVADVPLSATDGQDSIVRLTATTSYTAITGADSPTAVDVVFADTDRDGTESDDNSYTIESAALTMTKAATVVDDGFGTTAPNAKAIPGATVEYTITIENNGSAGATGLTVTDTIPTELTYVPGTLQLDGLAAGTVTGNSVSVPVPTLNTGATATVTFRVTIN
jgi:uncharacterized repeat protein (TIGR01451 family)